MRTSTLKFLTVLALASPTSGYGAFADKKSELVLSGTGGVASGGAGLASLSLYGEYLRHVGGPVQLGAELGLNYISGAGGLGYSLLLGPTFNLFQEDFENSPFFTARGGITSTSLFLADEGPDALIDFGLGHRFQIFENVVYRPQVTLSKRLAEGTSWIAGVEPIAFSIVF